MKKGDIVVCLGTGFKTYHGKGETNSKDPKKGEIHTVTGTTVSPYDGGLYLHLKGYDPKVEVFCSVSFRKVQPCQIKNLVEEVKNNPEWVKTIPEEIEEMEKVFSLDAEF